MALGHPLVLNGDKTLFQVNVSESFTVPTSMTASSPTAQYVPSGVQGTFQNTREVAGGQLFLAVKDGAGPNNAAALEIELNPGDVVALSAVASNTVTVLINGVAVHRITNVMAAASVVGWYG
jgi:hypothetical protein